MCHALLCCVTAVMDDTSSGSCHAVHIINMDVQDNHDDATIGAFLLCQLCEEVCALWCNEWKSDRITYALNYTLCVAVNALINCMCSENSYFVYGSLHWY